MNNRFIKWIDSIWKLLFACALVFAISFGLSLLAIWLLPAGEIVGNFLRAIAAVISALLFLAYIQPAAFAPTRGSSEIAAVSHRSSVEP